MNAALLRVAEDDLDWRGRKATGEAVSEVSNRPALTVHPIGWFCIHLSGSCLTHSRIWNETWLAGFFYKPCNHKLFLKQALNMEMAIVMARESSAERDDIEDPFSEAGSFYRFKLFVYEPRLKIYKLMLPLLPCGNATMKGLTCWLSRSTRSTAGKASRKPQHERAMTLKGKKTWGQKNVKIDLMCGKEHPVEKLLMLEHPLLNYSFSCEEEFLIIAEYTSLLAYNQGRIISMYAKQPASWVCAPCLSEREDLCWAVKGCARIWWSNCKRSLQLQLRFVRFMGTNHPDSFPRLMQMELAIISKD
ncbi:hypothetical protein TRIUR3_19508 [Triticum urartu]|uniref:Uncharacterized protein n=1 Tax=Triticum urartu TaxID=4572 RepID=M7ZV59_TRIUA|nr:hypothetical protein TRIUR3_19508 [Triticum urartu]